MNDQLKRLLDSIQPEALSTIRLCKRLGYRPEDLVYKSLDDMDAVTQELRQIKYDHYKQRIMKIINEIQNIRNRTKTESQVQFSPINTEYEENKPQISIKERVLQNLIYQDLLRLKKQAEYYQQQSPKPQLKKIIEQPKQKKQHNIIQVVKKCKTQHESFKSTPIIQERVQIKKEKILNQDQQQITEQLQKIRVQEQKVMMRIEQFKREMRQNFHTPRIDDVRNKKEQLDNEQYQQLINRQYEKLLKLHNKQNQINKPIKSHIQIRNKTQSLVFDSELQQKIDSKIEKVSQMKSQILNIKSQIVSERLKIHQEDVNFNKYHNEQVKIKEDQKKLNKLCKTSKKSFEIDLKPQILNKQKQESIWEQVNNVAHLFGSVTEFEKYRSQMKSLLNKQIECLDQKYKNKIDIIHKILPQQLAQQVLQ